jgi:hypothetical protein
MQAKIMDCVLIEINKSNPKEAKIVGKREPGSELPTKAYP